MRAYICRYSILLLCSVALLCNSCSHPPVQPFVAPTYNFTFADSSNYLDPVCFTSTGTHWKKSIHWDFGDGTSSTDSTPCHTFLGTGEYIVTLLADGQSQYAISKTVHVLNVQGTELTPQVVGTWRCHHYQYRFMNTYTQSDTLADTAITIRMLNHSWVCVGLDTIPWHLYDTLPRRLLIFEKNTMPNSVGFVLHDVDYYPDQNQVGYSVNVYKGLNDQYVGY